VKGIAEGLLKSYTQGNTTNQQNPVDSVMGLFNKKKKPK
jgi:hypothetical protein